MAFLPFVNFFPGVKAQKGGKRWNKPCHNRMQKAMHIFLMSLFKKKKKRVHDGQAMVWGHHIHMDGLVLENYRKHQWNLGATPSCSRHSGIPNTPKCSWVPEVPPGFADEACTRNRYVFKYYIQTMDTCQEWATTLCGRSEAFLMWNRWSNGQLFGSAWQVAPRDFPALNCPLVLHCNLADEKSETYVTLRPRNIWKSQRITAHQDDPAM